MVEQIGIFKFTAPCGGLLTEMKAGAVYEGVSVTMVTPMAQVRKKLYRSGRGIQCWFTDPETRKRWRVIVKEENCGQN